MVTDETTLKRVAGAKTSQTSRPSAERAPRREAHAAQRSIASPRLVLSASSFAHPRVNLANVAHRQSNQRGMRAAHRFSSPRIIAERGRFNAPDLMCTHSSLLYSCVPHRSPRSTRSRSPSRTFPSRPAAALLLPSRNPRRQHRSSMLKPGQVLQPGVGFEDSSASSRPAAASGFWSIKYYQPLFDVDTLQVLNRIKGCCCAHSPRAPSSSSSRPTPTSTVPSGSRRP